MHIDLSADQPQHYVFDLQYSDLRTPVGEIDLSLGMPGTTGGVLAILCSNRGAGGRPCPGPASPGKVGGEIRASDMTGGAARQGALAGDLAAFGERSRAGSST